MILYSQRGSVAVESTVTLLVFSIILTGGFFILYLAFARVWLERQTYETLVCLGSTTRPDDCERALRLKVRLALPIGHLESVQASRTSSRAEVRLSFAVLESKIIRLGDSRRLPLFAGAAR